MRERTSLFPTLDCLLGRLDLSSDACLFRDGSSKLYAYVSRLITPTSQISVFSGSSLTDVTVELFLIFPFIDRLVEYLTSGFATHSISLSFALVSCGRSRRAVRRFWVRGGQCKISITALNGLCRAGFRVHSSVDILLLF